jgi:hypothetical protein
MKRILIGLGLTLAYLTSALAQVPNAQPPYNQPFTALLGIAAKYRETGTVYGALQSSVDKSGVICRLHQNLASSSSGTPSTTFGIQIYDAVAQSYLQYPVSGAVTTAADTDIIMKVGAVATSVPTNTTVWGLPLASQWRVFMTVAGTGAPGINSQVECGYLR